jgi:hypothetical protein
VSVFEDSFPIVLENFNYKWIFYIYFVYKECCQFFRKATCEIRFIYFFISIPTICLKQNFIFQIR